MHIEGRHQHEQARLGADGDVGPSRGGGAELIGAADAQSSALPVIRKCSRIINAGSPAAMVDVPGIVALAARNQAPQAYLELSRDEPSQWVLGASPIGEIVRGLLAQSLDEGRHRRMFK